MKLDMTNRSTMIGSFPQGVVAEIGVQNGDFADTIIRMNNLACST